MPKQLYSNIMNGYTAKACNAVEQNPDFANAHFIHLASGITALSTACRFRRHDIAAFLLAHKAKINDTDNQGKTALFYAVAHFDAHSGSTALLQMLLDHGADTSLLFEIPIPEKPSKDYFCFNCTGVADDGTNEPSRDLTNRYSLVVYRQKKLTALEIAETFKLQAAVEILQSHALKKASAASCSIQVEELSPGLKI
ncbi:MAG: ankyrin repeat domain-containing protein [Gammaproteobacteria bacterium]|nr:ankyrin repeat domain-containing protein [Gammaproteobacteria bacterium]